MRNVIAVEALKQALAPVGEVASEVVREGHRDEGERLFFAPSPERTRQRESLGLLGSMVAEPCFVECFLDAPDAAEVLDCHRRHLNTDADRRQQDPQARLSNLWILCLTPPRTALRVMGFVHIHRQPLGLYTCAPGLRMRMIVLTELAPIRDTLFFRLMGRGDLLKHAIGQLSHSPAQYWVRKITVPILASHRATLKARERALLTEEQAFVDSTEALDTFDSSSD